MGSICWQPFFEPLDTCWWQQSVLPIKDAAYESSGVPSKNDFVTHLETPSKFLHYQRRAAFGGILRRYEIDDPDVPKLVMFLEHWDRTLSSASCKIRDDVV